MPRLNFTGRRRISRRHVRISVTGIGGIETFSADLDLEPYGFPPSARIVVEAYRQLDLIRFDFGTVGRMVPPEDCRLSEFGTLQGLRFRVRVVSVDPPRGRLLGTADRLIAAFQYQQSQLRIPLLLVRSQDIGREVWRLNFDEQPVLLVNSRVVEKQQLVRTGAFQSLVLPELLRCILTRILLVDQRVSADLSDSWWGRWLRFAVSLPGVPPLPSHADILLCSDWIDSVIGSFCRWRETDQQFVAIRHQLFSETTDGLRHSSETVDQDVEEAPC